MKPHITEKFVTSDGSTSPMNLRVVSLSFSESSGQLENQFVEDYYNKYINQIRIALFVAILFYSVFGILDARLMPEMKNQLWFIRYVVFFPLATLVLVWTFFQSYKNYMQVTLSFIIVLAGLGIVTMIIIAPPPVNYSYYAGLMLIFIFGYTFIRARFICATLSGWFIVLCYEIGAMIISDTPLPILINNNFFFISANVIGMFSCYSIEYAARRDFFLARLLVFEQEKTEKANEMLEDRVKERTDLLASTNKDLKQEIVERKRVETELREIHNVLELRVEERTQALKDMHDKLEIRVEERTLELQKTNVELIKAKDIADESARAKTDFLANMSHEIRTPMNAVIGMSELALNPDLNGQKRLEYLAIINSSGKSLLGIINEILDFSKIEAGKLEIETTPFNLTEIINSVADLFIDEIHKKRIELIVDLPLDVPADLIGDPLRLQQVIVNLVSNALKFTENGYISIHVHNIEENQGDVLLKFSIKDTGIGIHEKAKEKLFDAFSQADSSTTRKYGGTGLGLAICNKIIQMMKGEIIIESTPGDGSTFCFSLGFKKNPASTTVPIEVPSDISGKKILLAEDNPITQGILEQLLTSFGFLVHLAKTGNEAIVLHTEHEATHPFDLLICNNNLADMDGQTLMNQIRSGVQELPVVMMDDWYNIEKISLSAGAHRICHIQKPVRSAFLLDAIMESFGHETENKTLFDFKTLHNYYFPAEVLLVEDNNINQIVATEILTLAGMTVHIANNGLEALEKIEEEDFDVVLMDVQMPIMDGLAATAKIRENPDNKDLPVIAMTAHAIYGDREKCLDAGMDDYISKPIDRLSLYRVLKKYLSEETMPDSLYTSAMSDQVAQMQPIDIPGVNMEKGMSRIGCNYDRYIAILYQFCQDFESIILQIRENITLSKLTEAKEKNHSLKGASGNLSLTDIHTASQSLEKSIDDENKEQMEDSLFLVEDGIANLRNFLKDLMSEQTTKPQQPEEELEVDSEKIKSLLTELDKSLGEFNPVESKIKIEQFREYLSNYEQTVELNTLSNDLENQIKIYQFEKAREIIKSYVQ